MYPFSVKKYIPKVDSYEGIVTSIRHAFIATVVTPGIDIFKVIIPYYVRSPMPV